MHKLNISGTTLAQATERGIDAFTADKWACRLGLHPAEVWPDWWPEDDRLSAIFIGIAVRESA